MYLTAHAQERIEERLPGVSVARVQEAIEAGGVTVSSGWRALDGWQKKEFLVFWLEDAPWVAILDVATRACLTIIPAWNGERDRGVGLYEKKDGSPVLVGYVNESHVRRAILCVSGPEAVPERFLPSRYRISVRVLSGSGRVRVFRLDTVDASAGEIAESFEAPEWKEKALAFAQEKLGGEAVAELVLSASLKNRNFPPIEKVLVEAPTRGGWSTSEKIFAESASIGPCASNTQRTVTFDRT